MEFIDLTEQEEQTILNFEKPNSSLNKDETIEVKSQPILNITPGEQTEEDILTFDIEEKELSEKEDDSICVKECSQGVNIKCSDASGYFLVDNLFAELKTDYDKQVARTNLGIGTDLSLKWGNLLGNLANQTDLVKFITEQITTADNSLYDKVLTKINELNTQSKTTILYYGPNVENLTKSTNITFTTGDYDGYIYVLTPNKNTTFIVNGICGGFEYVSTQQYEGQVFYLFKSAYEKLGVTTITVSYG